jgi:Anti-sigma-K factor rskA
VTTPRPHFDDLIGADLPTAERRRLKKANDLLLRAGPLPELPASLLRPPATSMRRLRLVPLPTRRTRRAVVAVAAAVAVAGIALSAGYFTAAHRTSGFRAAAVIEMHGTAAAPTASATIRLGSRDRAGNWPMLVSVKGLPPLPRGSYYYVYLTKDGRPAASCGTFNVDGKTTVVRLNAPYELDEYSGWIVTRRGRSQPPGPPLLTTSPA